MEQTIHTQLKDIVDGLKTKVYNNIKVIENNDIIVRDILTEPVSEQRTSKLKKWLDRNQILMEENKELVALQLSILGYLTKFEPEENEDDYDEEQIFDLTVSRNIPYDNNHPLYNDETFKKELIDHYSQLEDYEACAKILNPAKY